MACALSCGEALFGEYEIPEPMQVLYIQTESTRHETIERLRMMTHKDGVSWDENNFHLMHTPSLSIDTDAGITWLVQRIEAKKIKPKVIFIDPLYMCMQGDLSDNMASRTASKNIRILNEHFGCTNVINHHEHRPVRSKSGAYHAEGDNAVMGSFVWKAFPNHIIHLSMLTDKTRILSCSTQRSSRVIENMKLKLDHPLPLRYSIIGSADHPAYVDQVYKWIDRHGPRCAKDIHEQTGLSISAVKKSLSYLSRQDVGKLKKLNPGSRPTLYGSTNGTTKDTSNPSVEG
jgi:RecA-family ATPase